MSEFYGKKSIRNKGASMRTRIWSIFIFMAVFLAASASVQAQTAETPKYRIAIAEVLQETNSFSPVRYSGAPISSPTAKRKRKSSAVS